MRPVSESSDFIVVRPDGLIDVNGREAAEHLASRQGAYRLVLDVEGLLILRGAQYVEPPPGAARVLMAGEIVSRTTVLEVINVIATSGWRGDLHVFGGDGHHRALNIDKGAVKSAKSDHLDDRLGQVLYGNGAISKAQLDELLSEVTAERRIGQLVLEKGILDQERLFQQLRKQIEQIFFASLLARQGAYMFVTQDDAAPPPAHSVHLSVAALLMEGVQRIDEMALFREKIPSDDLVPEGVPRVSAMQLDETGQLMLMVADGERTIEDIARETGLGTFHTVKALYGLVQQGLVVLRSRRALDVAEVRRLVTEFNDVLRDIFMAVATYGGVDQTRSTLEAWVQGSGYSPIFGEHVEEDGTIRVEMVVSALEQIQVENPLDGLLQALHELTAFALFAATTTLPRDQELLLSRDVTQRLKRIRV